MRAETKTKQCRNAENKITCAVIILLTVIQIVCCSPSSVLATVEDDNLFQSVQDYTIGAGDILQLMVWKNDELTKTLPVRPDGRITLPLIGEIMVEGMSVNELSQQLRTRYSKYVTDPIVYVTVQQVNSMNVFIIGRVNAPGVRPITSKTNVLQALAMASGLTPFAEGDEIKIFRTEKDGSTSILEFDYEDVSRGRNLYQNIYLQRGDVIVVP